MGSSTSPTFDLLRLLAGPQTVTEKVWNTQDSLMSTSVYSHQEARELAFQKLSANDKILYRQEQLDRYGKGIYDTASTVLNNAKRIQEICTELITPNVPYKRIYTDLKDTCSKLLSMRDQHPDAHISQLENYTEKIVMILDYLNPDQEELKNIHDRIKRVR